MAMSLFPPILNSTQPAFDYTTANYMVYFSLQNVGTLNNVKHIQIKINAQSSNKNMVKKTVTNPDGIIYLPVTSIVKLDGYNQYGVVIQSSNLVEQWKIGALYRIQLRFGINEMFVKKDGENIANNTYYEWKEQQVQSNAFSEWSNICITKAIEIPRVHIKNQTGFTQSFSIIQRINLETVRMPTFIGECVISDQNKEPLDKYKFVLYKKENDIEDILLEDSGWIQFNAEKGSDCKHQFDLMLYNGTEYKVIFTISTYNGFVKSSDPYVFTVDERYIDRADELANLQLYRVEENYEYDRENACVSLRLETILPQPNETSGRVFGNYVLIRSCKEDNKDKWSDLTYIFIDWRAEDEQQFVFDYKDYTVECGKTYYYNLVYENLAGVRSQFLNQEGIEATVYFEHSYLVGMIGEDTFQLKMAFNNKLSSFKHTTQQQKQDTIGSRYATITQSGHAHYAEFPISATISYALDPNELQLSRDSRQGARVFEFKRGQEGAFVDKNLGNRQIDQTFTCDGVAYSAIKVSNTPPNEGDYSRSIVYYSNTTGDCIVYENGQWSDEKYRLITLTGEINDAFKEAFKEVSRSPYSDGYDYYYDYDAGAGTSAADQLALKERKFRDKIDNFLTDGNYKLFKSPTEGNIIVGLVGVSFTPNETLSRKIADVSATAYEVAENTLENIINYRIIASEISKVTSTNSRKKIGQLSGYFTGLFQHRPNPADVPSENPENLIELMRRQHTYTTDSGEKYELKKLLSFWIEQYPQISLDKQIMEKKALISELNTDIEIGTYIQEGEYTAEDDISYAKWEPYIVQNLEEGAHLINGAGERFTVTSVDIDNQTIKVESLEPLDVDDVQEELDKLIALDAAIKREPEMNVLTLQLDGQYIRVGKNRVYSLRNINDWYNSALYMKFTGPLIINYIYEEVVSEDTSTLTNSIDDTLVSGQVAGFFTDSYNILDNYNYGEAHEKKKNPYFDTQIYDFNNGHTYVNCYRNMNLATIIEQKVRFQVEREYKTKFLKRQWYKKLQENQQTQTPEIIVTKNIEWISPEKLITYTYRGLQHLDIEADPGTGLTITYRIITDTVQVNNGETPVIYQKEEHVSTHVFVGSTGKYVLKPLNTSIDDSQVYIDVVNIKFDKPSFAIANYVAYTEQALLEEVGQGVQSYVPV